LLLDTHVWLWSLLEPTRLAPRLATALSSPENELWLSPIALWEVLVLAGKGRVQLRPDPFRFIEEALHQSPMREAPLTHAVAVESRRVRLPHRDPADRFIVATARVYDLTLATADRVLLRARPVPTLWRTVRDARREPRPRR
jgi:PIN domain nuclease of toxin-antitoxin system